MNTQVQEQAFRFLDLPGGAYHIFQIVPYLVVSLLYLVQSFLTTFQRFETRYTSTQPPVLVKRSSFIFPVV
jgi:hypothetical protein